MANDYAQLAGRISSYTTRCLLTAVVLVAGLGFGRQVWRWWADDGSDKMPAETVVQVAGGLGDPARLHVVEFGDQPWSLRRQSISGDHQAAALKLREQCRDALQQAPLPDGEAGDAETEFLRGLSASDPVEHEPGKWWLYEWNEGLPMAVGMKSAAAGAASPSDEQPAEGNRRVVTWGLAFPAGTDTWSVCTFQPEDPSVEGDGSPLDIGLPPECRRILSIRVAGGGAMLVFDGDGQPETLKSYYDGWFARHNWKAAGRWQDSGSAWYRRYTGPKQAPLAAVDIHLSENDRGGITGLLMMTPSPNGRGN